MRRFKFLVLVAAAGICLAAAPPKTEAQVSISIGVAPVCPYGYFDYPPYSCAPYGYYGPEWFVRGVFIGAGPWFHGPANFRGHVDNRFDPRHGYHGRLPARGSRPVASRPPGRVSNFKGNEVRAEHAQNNKGHNNGGRGH